MIGAGTGAMLCAHCGRPMLTSVFVGGMSYHPECTQPPARIYEPAPQYPWPAGPAVTEDRLREIVREELERFANGKGKPT